MKNNKGITLIALVITIIVLLILAGVSIAMLTGQNGILTQANTAKVNTSKAEAEEAIKLGLNEILANKMDPTYTGSQNVFNQSNIETLIKSNNSNVTEVTAKPDNTTESEETKYYEVTATVNGQTATLFVTTAGAISTTAPSVGG